MRENYDIAQSGRKSYVISIHDERKSDEKDLNSNPLGVIITMGNEKLFKRCVDRPSLGCDGTFSVVAKEPDNVNIEPLFIVVKEEILGKTYVPFRAFCLRKTLTTRKVVLNDFLRKLKEFGLQDPMTSHHGNESLLQLILKTYLKFSFGQSLVEVFRPDLQMTNVLEIL